MKLIGISGKKGSGKTTVAEYLKQQCCDDDVVHIVPFAGTLKTIVAQTVFGRPYFVESMKAETTCGKTGREWLQIIGTDWFRKANPECWINAFKAQVYGLQDCQEDFDTELIIIVPDVRFPNEVACIQEMSNPVIRLLRNPYDDKHESETALDHTESYSISYLNDPYAYQEDCFEAVFDAVIDNRKMGIDETDETIWKLIKERNWL